MGADMKIDDTNFEKALRAIEGPVMLIFKASFCGPSAMLDPLLDDLSEDYEDVLLVDIDVERSPVITRHYQVKQTPTMILFHKGEPLGTRMGTSTYDQLEGWLKHLLATKISA